MVEKQRQGLTEDSGQYQYQYDALQRLTHVSKDQEVLRQYTYDAFGNRTSKQESTGSTTYQYNALNQLIKQNTPQATKQFNYDQRGNLVEELINNQVTKSFTFDATNMMTQVTTASGDKATYQYNGLRNRTGQTVEKANEPLKQIQYILDLTKPYNNLLTRQVNEDKELYLWDNDLLAKNEEEYFLLDDLGSPLRQLTNTGQSLEEYAYDEFGHSLLNKTTSHPFGFTGYQQDEISGLNYAQARYYDQGHGRFVSKDTSKFIRINEIGTLNQYNYCQGNPINFFDPMGFDLENKYPLNNKDKKSPIQVTVDGNEVTIDAYVEFKGDVNEKIDGTKYKDLAIEGIENWGGDYSGVFGEDVKVNVNIHEGKNASWWEFWNWGGQSYYLMNLNSGDSTSYVTTKNEIPSSGAMNLFVRGRDGKTMVKVAQHEFGHVLGIDDGYGDEEDGRPDAFEHGLIPYTDVMKSVTWENGKMTISSKVIEMMILAKYENKFQYFLDYNKNKKSKAWKECLE